MPIADSGASSRYVRCLFQTGALLGALMSSACLSLSVVPQDDDEPPSDGGAGRDDAGGNEKPDGGEGEVDAGLDGGELDGGETDAEVDAGETDVACIDRGSYLVGAVEVQGLANTCDGSSVCVDGKCVAPPACTKGMTHECLFRPEGAHGSLMTMKMQGDYVYWAELGSYDARGNYQGNGSIARAKIGTWQREELATSLFFLAPNGVQLKIEGDIVFAQVGIAVNENVFQTFRVSRTPGQAVVSDTRFDTVSLRGTCTYAGQQFWNEGITTYRRSLSDLGSADVLIPELGFADPTCVAGEDFLLMTSFNENYLASTTGGGTWRKLSSDAAVFATYGDKLVGRRGAWIATAPLDLNASALSWTNVAGGGNVDATAIAGDYGYWTQGGLDRQQRVIVRGKLDGTGTQQVVAEQFDLASTWPFDASEAGAAWLVYGGDYIHFAPLPAP